MTRYSTFWEGNGDAIVWSIIEEIAWINLNDRSSGGRHRIALCTGYRVVIYIYVQSTPWYFPIYIVHPEYIPDQ